MNARRFPRTLAEAFGPYTDNVLHDPPEAVFSAWVEWRKDRSKPETAENYQRDQVAEHTSMQIERTR